MSQLPPDSQPPLLQQPRSHLVFTSYASCDTLNAQDEVFVSQLPPDSQPPLLQQPRSHLVFTSYASCDTLNAQDEVFVSQP